MRKLRDVLRLHFTTDLSQRQIARSLQMSHRTVGKYLKRLSGTNIDWPLPEDDSQLYALFGSGSGRKAITARPDWSHVYRERKRKGVTLQLLWQEYRLRHPDGLSYSRFCECYTDWLKRQHPVMRINHRAGEKLFVDYAGMRMPVIDPQTGEVKEAQIFVAVLGASNYTFCEATWTQSLPDWISSHIRAFSFFGGVPRQVVPDNLKSAVHRFCRYEPDINPTYAEMAAHYSVAVVPTRPGKPRDKAKVETGVLIIERQVLAPLRHRSFFSLDELNEVLSERVAVLNRKGFQKMDGSRQSLFDELDRPALNPLPVHPYAYAEWKKATVNIDYHVALDNSYYSVPHGLVGQRVDLRMTDSTVEVFIRNRRVASHVRLARKGAYSTLRDHMPANHREYGNWPPERLIDWATTIGPHTGQLIESILTVRTHPILGYRSCLGILRLSKRYGVDRLEAASKRTLAIGSMRYQSVASILKHGLETQTLPDVAEENDSTSEHANIRGAGYYRLSSSHPSEKNHA